MDLTSNPLAALFRRNLDAEAELEQLYRQQFGRVVAYFRRCGASDAEAKELAQDSFLRAFRSLNHFRGESQFSTWFWAIARNVLVDHLRQAKPDAVDTNPDDLPAGHCALSQHLRQKCLQTGFARFSADHPERAQALYLFAVEGLSTKELAVLLGRTEHATHEYLSQCRAKLRPYIADCEGLEV